MCANGLDDDGDGAADCDDPACVFTPSVGVCGARSSVEITDAACSDGVDNDHDGSFDCTDHDCLWNGDVSVCDRDGDGYSPRGGDCFDHPPLDLARAVSPAVPEMCGDGEDHDCDGEVGEVGCIQLDLGVLPLAYLYDGDTADIDGVGVVRFKGIDTPETWEEGDQGVECYGPEAKARAEALLAAGQVRVVLDAVDWRDDFRDLYGRILADLFLEDGTWVNGDLVGGGYACVWESYACTRKVPLLDLQDDARAEPVGLWEACGPSVCF